MCIRTHEEHPKLVVKHAWDNVTIPHCLRCGSPGKIHEELSNSGCSPGSSIWISCTKCYYETPKFDTLGWEQEKGHFYIEKEAFKKAIQAWLPSILN